MPIGETVTEVVWYEVELAEPVLEALRAEPAPKYPFVRFMALDPDTGVASEVTLDADTTTFSTPHRRDYERLVTLPFLAGKGETAAPEATAKDLIAGMGDVESVDDLEVLAKDSRSTVAKAAQAELDRRAATSDDDPEGGN